MRQRGKCEDGRECRAPLGPGGVFGVREQGARDSQATLKTLEARVVQQTLQKTIPGVAKQPGTAHRRRTWYPPQHRGPQAAFCTQRQWMPPEGDNIRRPEGPQGHPRAVAHPSEPILTAGGEVGMQSQPLPKPRLLCLWPRIPGQPPSTLVGGGGRH